MCGVVSRSGPLQWTIHGELRQRGRGVRVLVSKAGREWVKDLRRKVKLGGREIWSLVVHVGYLPTLV